jgi:hypothetical protein
MALVLQGAEMEFDCVHVSCLRSFTGVIVGIKVGECVGVHSARRAKAAKTTTMHTLTCMVLVDYGMNPETRRAVDLSDETEIKPTHALSKWVLKPIF